MSIGNSPHFLIVRLSAIGDVIHGIPVLNALRAHFPQSRISWVVEGRAGELLRGHPALDRLIVAPRGWLKSLAAVRKLRRELISDQPTIAIDLQSLARSALVALLSGARERMGLAGPDGREFSRWLYTRVVQPTATHVIDRYLQVLQPMGIHEAAVRFDMPPYAEEADAIVQYLTRSRLRKFAVINPGAGWPSKRWEMDRFAVVAGHLGRVHGLPSVVVWAGPEEHSWAERIVQESEGHALLAPKTTLRELAALVRRATLFLGCDTGPLHLAAAVGTASVALLGPVPAARNGPYGENHVTVQRVRLAASKRKIPGTSNEAMRAISVGDVQEACDQILSRGLPRRMSA